MKDKIAERVRVLRSTASALAKKTLTQQAAAEMAGVSKRSWVAYENGTRSMPDKLLEIFCRKAGIEYAEGMLNSDLPIRPVDEVAENSPEYIAPKGTHLLLRRVSDGSHILQRIDDISTIDMDQNNKTVLTLTSGRSFAVLEPIGALIHCFNPVVPA